MEGGGKTMFTVSTLEERARRIRTRAEKSNPRTPIGLIERQIALLHSHLEEVGDLRSEHLGAIVVAESKAGTDLLNWKVKRSGDLHAWLMRGDSIKARLNQIGTERRHIQNSFGLEMRGLRERLLMAINDLDQLRS
jgi:hypothetical protein